MPKLMIATAVLLSIVATSACSTESSLSPRLSAQARVGLTVSPPLIAAVFDGRASQSSNDEASVLQAELSRVYRNSFEWSDYFAKTPKGRVSVKVRINTLGSTFGSRLVSSVDYANAIRTAQATAVGPWGTVVRNVSTQESIVASSFSAEGWWNGAVWIDLEVQDLRGAVPVTFVLPIVTESRESNTWGYASADRAAKQAWDRASTQLLRAIDEIAQTVRDQEH